MAYKITAEVKKGWQDWGSITLYRDKKMTEKTLINSMGRTKNDFGDFKMDVLVRNFECVRI